MGEFVRRIDDMTCEYKVKVYDQTTSAVEWVYYAVYEPLTTTGLNPHA